MLCDQFDVHSFPKGMLAKAGEAEVADVISAIKPDVILHTAAISDTGYSEAHPEESYRANVSLPVWMARGAMLSGAKLVCFSSDQVYTGLADNGHFCGRRIASSGKRISPSMSWRPNSACLIYRQMR